MNKETKLKEYKGYDIYVSEGGNFRAYPAGRHNDSDPIAESSSLGTLQEKLKKKAGLTVQNKKVLFRDEPYHWSGDFDENENEELTFPEGTITAVTVKGKENYYTVRVEVDGGYQEHALRASQLYEPTPENIEMMKKTAELWKLEKRTEHERKILEEKLTEFTDEKLLGGGQ